MAESSQQPAEGSSTTDKSKGWFYRLLNPPKCSMLRMLTVGTIIGVMIWGGVNMGMEYTNRADFCISCHEMKDTVYEEYRLTTHASSRTGVRATYPDWHVPKSTGPKIVAPVARLQGPLPQPARHHRHAGGVFHPER